MTKAHAMFIAQKMIDENLTKIEVNELAEFIYNMYKDAKRFFTHV